MPTWSLSHPIKAAFFDADGTLLSFKTHTISESTKRALHALKKSGTKCFLATGRAPYMCDSIDTSDMEGFILFNGQFILDRYGVIFKATIDKDDVATVVGQVHQGLYECAFLAEQKAYASGRNELVDRVDEMAHISFPVEDIDQALNQDIYQFNIFLLPGKTDIVRNNTKHLKITRWTPEFVDAFPIDGGKSHGVDKMLEHYQIPQEESIAFGDGGNDLQMFGAAGTSVAMGNGNPEVKEEADFVTDDVDHNGIWNACVKLGLIDGELL